MKIKITIIKQTIYKDLMDKYELPLEVPCTLKVGQVFYTEGQMPAGFCDVAWETIKVFVDKLLKGENKFYGDWLKNPDSAIISCNDGVRPMSFLIEKVN